MACEEDEVVNVNHMRKALNIVKAFNLVTACGKDFCAVFHLFGWDWDVELQTKTVCCQLGAVSFCMSSNQLDQGQTEFRSTSQEDITLTRNNTVFVCAVIFSPVTV